MSEEDEVQYKVQGRVAIVCMNRPHVLNAMTTAGFGLLRQAFGRAEADPNVAGVVLTGEGRGFCAGLDMVNLSDLSDGADIDKGTAPEPVGDSSFGANIYQNLFAYVTTIRKPVVAAVNGVAAGGGFVLAACADIRIGSESAAFATAFARRGLVAEHGIAWALPRLVGTSRALDLIWSGRKIDAEEAHRIGLLDRVVPDNESVQTACEYIEGLAQTSSPWSMMIAKRLVYRDWGRGLDPAIGEMNGFMDQAFTGNDLKEGVASFVEKRPPKFPPLDLD